MGTDERDNLEIVLPENTKHLLKKHNINCNRSLGQNFLVDREVLASLITAADLEPEANVVEIGPGLGALTEAILQKLTQGKLLAVEKDIELAGILQQELGSHPALEIIKGDALELEWADILQQREFISAGYTLMANLPYYITSPVIRKFLEMKFSPDKMILMVQKEVAERITASPGGKDYGILSIAVQYYCYPEIVEVVPAEAFLPAPEVESAVLRLDLSQAPDYQVENENLFFSIVRAMFQQRRKMLRNSLSKAREIDLKKDLVREALNQADIDERLRGEKLSLDRIVELSNILNKMLENATGNGD